MIIKITITRMIKLNSISEFYLCIHSFIIINLEFQLSEFIKMHTPAGKKAAREKQRAESQRDER